MVVAREIFTVIGTLGLLCGAQARAEDSVGVPDHADYVLVDKSDHKLYLLKAGRVLREVDISLGLVPNGAKQREGDFRTPEGKYVLDMRRYESTDWTDGCIAVSNSDMVDIWLMTRESTPIEIRP